MTGTSSQVLNPPSLYSNLNSSLYLNVELWNVEYIYLFIKYYLYFYNGYLEV